MKKVLFSVVLVLALTVGLSAAVGVGGAGVASACAGVAGGGSSALAAALPRVDHGDRGRHVLALQLALRGEGYSYLDGTGNYAGETLRAVKDFQRRHHIKASGIVGTRTWQALVGGKSAAVTHNSLRPREELSLRPGERDEVKVAQLVNMLTRIHPYRVSDYRFDSYGPDLQKMVQDFQKRARIKASGIVGPKTVAAMTEVISVSGQWGC